MGELLNKGRFVSAPIKTVQETELVNKVDGVLEAGFYSTTADMDIYVDDATGDDTTGDGTVLLPYKTVVRAYEDVPYVLNHAVHIHIGAGSYTSFPETIEPQIKENGYLVFDGSLAMSTVDGPLTIDAGGWNVVLGDTVADLSVAAGAMVPNAYQNKYVRYTSGLASGTLAPILENSATVIRLSCYGVEPAPGDTFEIVEPGVLIDANSLSIKDTCVGGYGRIGLFGLGISSTAFGTFNVSGPVEQMWYSSVSMYGCVVDMYTSVRRGGISGSTGSLTVDATDWAIFGTNGVIFIDAIETFDSVLFAVQLYYVYACGMCRFHTVAAETPDDHSFYLANISGSDLKNLYAHPHATSVGLNVKEGSQLKVEDVYVELGLYGVRVERGSSLILSGLDGNAANIATAAIRVDHGSHVVSVAAGNVLLSTGGVAIKWLTGAADSAWPAADALVTDSLGAQVVGS